MRFSFSRLFGANRRRPFRRQNSRPGQSDRAKGTRLSLEGLEDRTLLAVLPTPLVSNQDAVVASGPNATNPSLASDPVNPQKLVTVYTYTNTTQPQPPNPKTLIGGRYSIDGGQSWQSLAFPTPLKDPNSDDGSGGHNPIPFSQNTDATVAIDRQENVYVTYTEHDDANKSGVLVLQKFAFTGNSPTQTITDNVLSRYLGEPVLNPEVAVDNNVPTFTDTAPNGTQLTQTDTMVGKAVYVAFNTNNVAPKFANEGGPTFNANTIKVIASADGGQTFTTQQYVNDGGAGPAGRTDPNYTTSTPTAPLHHYAMPQIVFTQGNAGGSVAGGQLTFVYDDFVANQLVVDGSRPDSGVLSQPAAAAINKTATYGQLTGHINEATDGGDANNKDQPDLPNPTPFTITLNNSDIDPNFQAINDLNVGLSLYHPHDNQLVITLSAVDANGNPLGSAVSAANPTGAVTLVRNRQSSDPTVSDPTVPPPAPGLPDVAGMGGVLISASNPFVWHPDELVFDQKAPRAINDPGLAAADSGYPFIGHFRPEDDSAVFGVGKPNLNGGPNGDQGLDAFNGLTRAQLVGSKWTLTITDVRNDDTTTPPPQFLDFFRLNISSSISTTGFGADTAIKPPTGSFPSPVTGAPAAPFPLASPSNTRGIGPAVSVAVDNTLGAYSPYQGRLYVAYTSLGSSFPDANGVPRYTDNSDITLVASDNGGKTWNALPGKHFVTVNNDSPADGFSEGSRPQFLPKLAVDNATGTLVATFYDARYDAARARVSTYVADSIDGGQTFGPETYLNPQKTALDEITAARTGPTAAANVVLEPVPSNMGLSGTPLGFGDHMGLVVNAGHVVPVWAGNKNDGGSQLFTSTVTIAAGPRVVSGDEGPVTKDFTDPLGVVTYNNTFAADGTRQLTGFVVTFDRPVDVSTFTPANVFVLYHDPSTPATQPGTPMAVSRIVALDAGTLFGPDQVGGLDKNGKPTLATEFRIDVVDPATETTPGNPLTGQAPSRVGTYSYYVGPNVSDRIRGGKNTIAFSGNPVTYPNTTPAAITNGNVTTSSVTVNAAAGLTIAQVFVSLNITYDQVADLRLTLIAADGTRVLLVPENTARGANYGTATQDTVFADNASQGKITPNSPAPFLGSWVPAQPLSNLVQHDPNGKWTLEVNDVGTFPDAGTLNRWALTIQFGTVSGSTVTGNLMDQNQNAVTGENPGDLFVIPTPTSGTPFALPYDPNTLPLIIPGPHLQGSFVNGAPATPDNLVLNQTVSNMDVVFDRAMNASSFDGSGGQVLRFFGPTGLVPGQVLVTVDPNPGYARTIKNVSTAAPDPGFIAVTSLSSANGVATATTQSPHNFKVGDQVVVAGLDQGQYNGTFTVTAVPSPTQFTYQVPANTPPVPTGRPAAGLASAVQFWTFKVAFPAQQLSGTYTLTWAPSMTDTRGDAVDTNLNAGLDVLRGVSPDAGQVAGQLYDSRDPKTNADPPVDIAPGKRVFVFLNVPDNFNVQSAKVLINIADVNNKGIDPHLAISFGGPDGSTVRLVDGAGDTRLPNGFQDTVFDDNASTPIQKGTPPFNLGPYNPITPLSTLVGKASKGRYGLQIDNLSTDPNAIAHLNYWSITLGEKVPGTGLGQPVADQFTTTFRIFTMSVNSPLAHDQWTAVGPAAENADGEGLNGANSGRVTALAVDPSDPSGNTVYVGGASGGVWKTTDFLTTSAKGPTYQPLTDFGPTNGLYMGGLAVFPHNNDPRQSVIFAATGEGDTGTPGVGILRSMDGGATWQLLDSSSNTTDPHVGLGTLTGINDVNPQTGKPYRDHVFVGNSSFQIVVDPNSKDVNNILVYVAMSGPNGGVWVSRDSGLHWGNVDPSQGNLTLGTANLAGPATDVALSAGSANPSAGAGFNQLQGVFAAVAGKGVFVSHNQGITFTQTAPAGIPYQGNNLIRDGDLTTPTAIPVKDPPASPNGANGRIDLVTPAATGNALQDFLLQGWVYAAVVTTTGHLQGLYMSKDYGDNWTVVTLPELRYGAMGVPPQFANGVPSNDVTLPFQADPLGSQQFAQGNYNISLVIDPNNPNVVYLGGTDDGQIAPQGGEIRIDTTALLDAKAFVAFNNHSNDGGKAQTATDATSGITLKGPPFSRPYGIYENGFPPSQDEPILNLERDPYNGIFVQGSTILVKDVQQFNNLGSGSLWLPFNDGLGGSTDQHRVVSIKDPTTGHVRLIWADDQGVFTGVDTGGGQLVQSLGATADITQVGGNVPIVTGSRNGNLQVAQFYYGASQPSNLAAQIAGALLYGMAQDNGFPRSDANVLANGNLNWVGPTGDGTGVATDQTGSGTAYFYKWPCCLGGEGPGGGGSFGATDFYQVDIPGTGLVSRTGGNGSNLVRAGDDPANNQGEWPFVGGGQPDGRVVGNFAVNPINPQAMVITSAIGRVFRTTDQGKNWFIIGGGAGDASVDLDGKYAPAMAFGAPDPTATPGNLDNFIYAGTEGGHIFVTFTGGGFNGSTKWKDISAGLDGSAVEDIITDPTRGTHDAYAVTLNGVYYMPDSTSTTATWQNITGNVFSLTHDPFGNPAYREAQLKYLTSVVADWRFAVPDNFSNPSGPTHPVLYVAGNGGVFRSVDRGAHWTVFPGTAASTGDGANQDGGMLANTVITSLSIEYGNLNPANGIPDQRGGPDLLMANTYGRGQFAIRLPNNNPALGAGTSPYLTVSSGPRVVNGVASGFGANDINAITVTFSGPVEPTSIQSPTPDGSVAGVNPASVARLLGPGNKPITITAIVDVTPAPKPGQPNLHNVYQIQFADQTAGGTYYLLLGPNVTDFSGEPMDQNQNGVNGETAVSPNLGEVTVYSDAYFGTFFVTTRAPDGNPATHPAHPVPGVVSVVAQTGQVMVVAPNPAGAAGYLFPADPNSPPSVWSQLPPLPAGDKWVDFVTGDFTGDGKTDFAVRDLQTGRWYVGVNNGSSFTFQLWGGWYPGVTWVDVRVGYFQGRDHPAEIAGRALELGQWFVAESDGTKFTSLYWGGWYAGPALSWADVVVGDFNGDGKDDIAGRTVAPGSSLNNQEFVSVSTGTNWLNFGAKFAFQWTDLNANPNVPVADIAVGDFTGAVSAQGFRIDDIVGRVIASDFGRVYVMVPSNQPDGSVAFTPHFWQTWSNAVTWVDVKVGDFDGDGHADLVARVLQNGVLYASTGFDPNRNYVTNPDGQHMWGQWSTGTNWNDTQALDLNGDGQTDLISRADNGVWYVAYADPQNKNRFLQQVTVSQWDPSKTYVSTQRLYQI